MLHNFIRLNRGYEDEFDSWNDIRDGNEDNNDDIEHGDLELNDNNFRNNLAEQMWIDYQNRLNNDNL